MHAAATLRRALRSDSGASTKGVLAPLRQSRWYSPQIDCARSACRTQGPHESSGIAPWTDEERFQ